MKKKLVAVVVALVLVLGAGVWWWLHRPASPTQQNPVHNTAPVRSTPERQFTASDAERLQTALDSTDKSMQADALAPETKAAYMQSGAALPTGITFLPDTFTANGNFATVDATQKDGSTYRVLLSRQDSASPWLIVNTERK